MSNETPLTPEQEKFVLELAKELYYQVDHEADYAFFKYVATRILRTRLQPVFELERKMREGFPIVYTGKALADCWKVEPKP